MSITPDQIKAIRTEFARLKPTRVRLDGSRLLTVREAIFALAPTLERMRRRGFELAELTEKLHDKGIEISGLKRKAFQTKNVLKDMRQSFSNVSIPEPPCHTVIPDFLPIRKIVRW